MSNLNPKPDALLKAPASPRRAPALWTLTTGCAIAICFGVMGATAIGPLAGGWVAPNAQPWAANVIGGAAGAAIGAWLGLRRSQRIYEECHSLNCEGATTFDIFVTIVLSIVTWVAIGLFLGYMVGGFGQIEATWTSAVAVLTLAGAVVGLAIGITDRYVRRGSSRLAAHVAAGAIIGAIAGHIIGGPLVGVNMAIFMGGFHSHVLWEDASPDGPPSLDAQRVSES